MLVADDDELADREQGWIEGYREVEREVDREKKYNMCGFAATAVHSARAAVRSCSRGDEDYMVAVQRRHRRICAELQSGESVVQMIVMVAAARSHHNSHSHSQHLKSAVMV